MSYVDPPDAGTRPINGLRNTPLLGHRNDMTSISGKTWCQFISDLNRSISEKLEMWYRSNVTDVTLTVIGRGSAPDLTTERKTSGTPRIPITVGDKGHVDQVPCSRCCECYSVDSLSSSCVMNAGVICHVVTFSVLIDWFIEWFIDFTWSKSLHGPVLCMLPSTFKKTRTHETHSKHMFLLQKYKAVNLKIIHIFLNFWKAYFL